jgi:hypothetical protein
VAAIQPEGGGGGGGSQDTSPLRRHIVSQASAQSHCQSMHTRAQVEQMADDARIYEGLYKILMSKNGWVSNSNGSMTCPNGKVYGTWAAAYAHVLAGWESDDDSDLFPSAAELRSHMLGTRGGFAWPHREAPPAPAGRPTLLAPVSPGVHTRTRSRTSYWRVVSPVSPAGTCAIKN